MAHGGHPFRLTLIDQYLQQQREPTAVERFAHHHDQHPAQREAYRDLIPARLPSAGEQFAFQVDLDRCTSCKACVTACHSLNGLDEGETWRFVGHVHGGSRESALQQSVTTACHHCVEPACLKGCPVSAYQKDAVTGIVKHLDDQCIGCQYCTLTCPYEVPQYSAKKGIVRKCDMCSDRLAAGEAPACVQACPNEAISITLVSQAAVRAEARAEAVLPGVPSPAITHPTTRFRSGKNLSQSAAVDFHVARPAQAHWPLVIMLVLTQLSVGAFAVERGLSALGAGLPAAPRALLMLLALATCKLGLLASIFHLGRPLYAFRAVLGLRTSWMSREIVAFGAFAAAAVVATGLASRGALAAAGLPALPEPLATRLDALASNLAAGSGLGAVFCSVMIYHVTRRRFWSGAATAAKFFGSTLVLGLASASFATFVVPGAPDAVVQTLVLLLGAASLAKLVHELFVLRHLKGARHSDLERSALLVAASLRKERGARLVLAFLGGFLLPCLAWLALSFATGFAAPLSGAALLASMAGELLERKLFFSAVSAPRMPGALS